MWQTGRAAQQVSRTNDEWRRESRNTLPELRDEDTAGSASWRRSTGSLLNVVRRDVTRNGAWQLLECVPARDGNPSSDAVIASAWHNPADFRPPDAKSFAVATLTRVVRLRIRALGVQARGLLGTSMIMDLCVMRPTARTERGAGKGEEQDLELGGRVLAEFRDMPGLVLTVPQASRLFSIEPVRCARILGSLVNRGPLSVDGQVFARADRSWHPD